jgi:hypothetical protein
MSERPPRAELLSAANDNEPLKEVHKKKIAKMLNELIQEGYPKDVLTAAAQVIEVDGDEELFVTKVDAIERLRGIQFDKEKIFNTIHALYGRTPDQMPEILTDEEAADQFATLKVILEELKEENVAKTRTENGKAEQLTPEQERAALLLRTQERDQKYSEALGLFNTAIARIRSNVVNPDPYLSIAVTSAIAQQTAEGYLERLVTEGHLDENAVHDANLDEMHLYENVWNLYSEIKKNVNNSENKDLSPLEDTIQVLLLKLARDRS